MKAKRFLYACLAILLIASYNAISKTAPEWNVDSLLDVARSKVEKDYTVPSFTNLRKAIVAVANERSNAGMLAEALNNLKPASMPYCITTNIYGDPLRSIAFNWFTNEGVTEGTVQVVKGIAADEKKFRKSHLQINATSYPVNDLNYYISGNNLDKLAGIPAGAKKSYTAHKAVVTNLKPGRVYSYRVGSDKAWSTSGTFRTPGKKDKSFSFIYTTDPQATTEADFNISQTTTHTAFRMFPGVNFWLCCGDLVNASGANNSEWEWEQFFCTQQDLFLNYPFAPILGNHDKSPNRNFTYHFNTDHTAFDREMSTTPGSVYSFVYGNALFLALSFEDYSKDGYLEALAKWMRSEVEKHPEVKWKIAFYHRTIYTGSQSHQDDNDGIIVRNRFAPLFDSLGIHLALQGHDHIYEVIGPVKNKRVVAGSIQGLNEVPVDSRENVTGKLNGIFNVSSGTLYFLNNSAGKKKYNPRPFDEMKKDEERLGVPGYSGLFTGRFGQTGRPTFSHVEVTEEKITITTFEVFDDGTAKLFDRFEVVK